MKSIEDADKRQTLRCVCGVLLGVNIGASDARAQAASRLPLIAIMDPGSAGSVNPWLPAFRQALAGLGWVEGRTVRFEARYADNSPDRMAGFAKELVALQPDLIFTHGGHVMVPLVARATATIPIVVGVSGDFVATGLAKSLARPGGNVTGMSLFGPELDAKRLEALRDAAPSARRIGVLIGTARSEHSKRFDEALVDGARPLGLQLQIVRAATPSDIRGAIAALKQDGADALLAVDGAMLAQAVPEVTALAIMHRLPSVSQSPGFADAGGLIQLGADVVQLFRSSARLVDKILRGAKPADLPIEQPTTFELVLNLKTATALGLKLPRALLARADRVVE